MCVWEREKEKSVGIFSSFGQILVLSKYKHMVIILLNPEMEKKDVCLLSVCVCVCEDRGQGAVKISKFFVVVVGRLYFLIIIHKLLR